jgi:hypothetical protein
MRIFVLLMSAVCMVGSGSTAGATTYVVRPDGSGDFPTIQAAVNAAVTGDVIELSNGTFTGAGNRDISIGGRSITIRSQSGDPATCTIDCQGAGRGFHLLPTEDRCAFVGITITAAVAEYGAGVFDDSYLGTDFTDCVFSHNTASSVGGGVATLESCAFLRCAFIENSSGEVGGGFSSGSGGHIQSPTFEACRFVGNIAGYRGGAAFLEAVLPSREASFSSCTFAFNTSSGGVVACAGCPAVISNSIIAFATDGAAVFCDFGGSAILTCCDVYGNTGGDWVGCIAGQGGQNGNLCLDPLFCDGPGGDLRLEEGSPCAPDYNPDCGLIGAELVGCHPTAVEAATWGAIKASFR